jgi:hypothetical protein
MCRMSPVFELALADLKFKIFQEKVRGGGIGMGLVTREHSIHHRRDGPMGKTAVQSSRFLHSRAAVSLYGNFLSVD